MKTKKLIAFIVLAVISVSCSKNTGDIFKLEEKFDLKVGETATLNNAPLNISFKTVLEDSRCPENVICVWEGQAKLEMEITGYDDSGSTQVFEIIKRVGHEELAYFTINDYEIHLLFVDPYPVDDFDTEIEDYSAEFEMKKL